MTTREAFTPEEWRSVLEGPPTAGMIVVTAARGGMWRETFAMSKAYAEARAAHGQSELLDEIVTAKPKVDHTTYASPEEFRSDGLKRLRAAVALVAGKATPDEADGYRRFVLAVADRVAQAHREDGQSVSPGESEAIGQISEAVGATSTA
jgi:hypothetical protein